MSNCGRRFAPPAQVRPTADLGAVIIAGGGPPGCRAGPLTWAGLRRHLQIVFATQTVLGVFGSQVVAAAVDVLYAELAYQ